VVIKGVKKIMGKIMTMNGRTIKTVKNWRRECVLCLAFLEGQQVGKEGGRGKEDYF